MNAGHFIGVAEVEGRKMYVGCLLYYTIRRNRYIVYSVHIATDDRVCVCVSTEYFLLRTFLIDTSCKKIL